MTAPVYILPDEMLDALIDRVKRGGLLSNPLDEREYQTIEAALLRERRWRQRVKLMFGENRGEP